MQLGAESRRFPPGFRLLKAGLAQITSHAHRHELLLLIGEYNPEIICRAEWEGLKGGPAHYLILHCADYEASRVCDLEGSVEDSH